MTRKRKPPARKVEPREHPALISPQYKKLLGAAVETARLKHSPPMTKTQVWEAAGLDKTAFYRLTLTSEPVGYEKAQLLVAWLDGQGIHLHPPAVPIAHPVEYRWWKIGASLRVEFPGTFRSVMEGAAERLAELRNAAGTTPEEEELFSGLESLALDPVATNEHEQESGGQPVAGGDRYSKHGGQEEGVGRARRTPPRR